jgi:hypothetical protein
MGFRPGKISLLSKKPRIILEIFAKLAGKLPVSLAFIFREFGSLESPARIYREALVDPHEDIVVVYDLVGTGKDRRPIKGGLAFKDFEFYHVSPGFHVVAAQDASDGDVCTHKLVPHCLGHT